MISWVVDDDNSVVKYCHNNIVTIYVPGDSETSGDNENDDEAEDIPGLAMTRSFGDAIAARVGVNAVPEI